jgi:hypothetical protein
MVSTRAKKLVLVVMASLVLGAGATGAFIGHSLEEEHQLHGVEPGPPATWALWRETASGFAMGALIGTLLASACGLSVRIWSRGRASR